MNFGEYFKSMREKLYSKLREEQNLRKVAELIDIFLTTPDEVEKYVEMMKSNFSDNCICHYNIKILNLQLINTNSIVILKQKIAKSRIIFCKAIFGTKRSRI